MTSFVKFSSREVRAIVVLFEKGIRNCDIATAFQATEAAISLITQGKSYPRSREKIDLADMTAIYARKPSSRFYGSAQPRGAR